MGEVYVAAYRVVDGRAALLCPEAVSAPDAFQLPGNEPIIAAGGGWQAYPALLERFAPRISSLRADLRPDAANLLRIAAQQFQAGAALDPADAQPVYLRDRVTG
jgi:tRNA threonylcarbamoyladenosine biosynthesis protein TsaB